MQKRSKNNGTCKRDGSVSIYNTSPLLPHYILFICFHMASDGSSLFMSISNLGSTLVHTTKDND
jgi:hypothetical protein